MHVQCSQHLANDAEEQHATQARHASRSQNTIDWKLLLAGSARSDIEQILNPRQFMHDITSFDCRHASQKLQVDESARHA